MRVTEIIVLSMLVFPIAYDTILSLPELWPRFPSSFNTESWPSSSYDLTTGSRMELI